MADKIDIYCERMGPAFWAEPVNALTNAAFIMAGIAVLYFTFTRFRQDRYILWEGTLLALLILAIGAGSFAFHTLATTPAMLADVIPIFLYQLCFLILYALHIMGHKGWRIFMLPGLFVVLSVISGALPRDWLNGSLSYAPALIILAALAVWQLRKGINGGRTLLAAAGIFIFSLSFRSIDMALCSVTSGLGTHFMWHILNACVLYLSARSYLLARLDRANDIHVR